MGWIGIWTGSTTLYVRGMAILVTTLVTPTFTVQDPALHVDDAEHLYPQLPQLKGSVFMFTQDPLQQVGVSPEQILPQEPQLPGLVERLTQVPPQFVLPTATQLNA